ncbi:hypothetical protein SLA2020_279360 [Shorea laevis]
MQNDENPGCGFFKWLDPKMCVYGEQVVSMLRDWHVSTERALIETTISNEVSKYKIEVSEYKSKIEVDAATFALQLERQRNNFYAKELKYQFALACSWGLVFVLLFYPACSGFSSRLMLA